MFTQFLYLCTRRFGVSPRPIYKEHYTVTGEDPRTFEPRLRDHVMTNGSGMKPGSHNHKCVLILTDHGNRPWGPWEVDDCNENQGHFCETFA